RVHARRIYGAHQSWCDIEAMRIATFNLESLGDDRLDEAALEERIAVLRPQISSLNADVLCLQEVNGQKPHGGGPRNLEALDRLLEGMPEADFYRAATTNTRTGGVGDQHNLVVLSRWPLREVHEIHHDFVDAPRWRRDTAIPADTDPQPIEWDRPILYLSIDLPEERTLHVFDVHFRAPIAAPVPGQKLSAQEWKTVSGWAEGYFVATMKRIGQALELRLSVDRLIDAEKKPLVAVAGDFNAERFESPLRIAVADVDDTGNAGLASYRLTPVERTLPEDERYTVLHHGRHLMLDHILVSPSLFDRLKAVTIHNTELADEAEPADREAGPIGSFHAPLVATFE
ncbi:MAG: endonuclease/exonuclease/phosphatase family protein, partial [Hyphomicrobiales bacterium]|nr:endonuclease/exonuclease/phosphatase family protein [Hyphomicrobiales bacterium]